VLCTLFTVGISLYLPFIIRKIIDGLTDGTISHSDLAFKLLLYAGLSVVTLYFSRHLRKIPMKLSHKVEYALRKDLFDHLTRMDQEFFRKERTGDIITRMSSDMTLVRDSIGQGLLQGIRTTVVILSASVVMLLTDFIVGDSGSAALSANDLYFLFSPESAPRKTKVLAGKSLGCFKFLSGKLRRSAVHQGICD
jgi:ATP-binding cassette subfamily B protein